MKSLQLSRPPEAYIFCGDKGRDHPWSHANVRCQPTNHSKTHQSPIYYELQHAGFMPPRNEVSTVYGFSSDKSQSSSCVQKEWSPTSQGCCWADCDRTRAPTNFRHFRAPFRSAFPSIITFCRAGTAYLARCVRLGPGHWTAPAAHPRPPLPAPNRT